MRVETQTIKVKGSSCTARWSPASSASGFTSWLGRLVDPAQQTKPKPKTQRPGTKDGHKGRTQRTKTNDEHKGRTRATDTKDKRRPQTAAPEVGLYRPNNTRTLHGGFVSHAPRYSAAVPSSSPVSRWLLRGVSMKRSGHLPGSKVWVFQKDKAHCHLATAVSRVRTAAPLYWPRAIPGY